MKRNFPLILVLLLFMCSKNPTSPSISKYQYLMSVVKPKVEEYRGLSFLREVHLALMSRSQYAASRYSGSSQTTDLYSVELKQLGFIPDTMENLGGTVDSYNENFAAAFYVPGTDSIYIINPDNYESVEFEFYLAHELTHALQEQHFNPFTPYIYPTLSQSASNSDFYLSQLNVIEGDASLSGYLYLINEYTDISENELAETFFSECEDFYKNISTVEVPRYLDITRKSPYILGQYFVAVNKLAQGWKAVNKCYHSVRVSSTAEIITGRSRPMVLFDFSKLYPVLLEDTRKLKFADDDTHGPIMLMALISQYTDAEHCKNAFGWCGDRIFYVCKDDQKYGSFVWALGFLTEEDAAYMMDAFDKLLSNRRFSNTSPERISSSANSITFTLPEITTTVLRQGTTILWIENLPNPMQVAELILPEVLAKSRTGKTDYSTLPKEEKWKLLRENMGRHQFRMDQFQLKCSGN